MRTNKTSESVSLDELPQVAFDGKGERSKFTLAAGTAMLEDLRRHFSDPDSLPLTEVSAKWRLPHARVVRMRDRMLIGKPPLGGRPSDSRRYATRKRKADSGGTEIGVIVEELVSAARESGTPGALKHAVEALQRTGTAADVGPPKPMTGEERVSRLLRVMEACFITEVEEAIRIWKEQGT
jgi:hypothetical protein